MPPKSALTSSFSITRDSTNEVICPLNNPDGSQCRKRCIGEKRFRSMQEHIRRAHPQFYIAKLPATEESFLMMVNRPPRPVPPSIPGDAHAMPSSSARAGPKLQMHSSPHGSDMHSSPHGSGVVPGLHARPHLHDSSPPRIGMGGRIPRSVEDSISETAAMALTQLQGLTRSSDIAMPDSSVELPPILPGYGHYGYPAPDRETLPSVFSGSPPGRSSTLPPLQRVGSGRARKHSVSKRAQQHKKQRSRANNADWLHRSHLDPTVDRLRPGGTIKAWSVEPGGLDHGKRWEDLIDAAASATDYEDEKTPGPQSPVSFTRASLPPPTYQPFQHAQPNGYQASPLQQALTPPSFTQDAQPFQSVESNESADVYNMQSRGLDNSSPTYRQQRQRQQGPIQIYCTACHGLSDLADSMACCECIRGFCKPCVEALRSESGNRNCPSCRTVGGKFKPFQLELR